MTRRYQVQDVKGVWSRPMAETEVWEYVRLGWIRPHTKIQDDQGRIFFAGDNPAFAAIFREGGVDPAERPAPHPKSDVTARVAGSAAYMESMSLSGRKAGIQRGDNTIAQIMTGIGMVVGVVASLAYPIPNLFIFVALVMLSVAVGKMLQLRGCAFIIGFAISLWLTPLVGILFVIATPINQEEIERRALASGISKKCPKCAEIIKNEATRCRYCGCDL